MVTSATAPTAVSSCDSGSGASKPVVWIQRLAASRAPATARPNGGIARWRRRSTVAITLNRITATRMTITEGATECAPQTGYAQTFSSAN